MPASQLRTRASNCVLLTISVICMCILVVCGVMIVREYSLSTGYKETSCVVANIEDAGLSSCRYCGTSTKDGAKKKGAGACRETSFPCKKVLVTYNGDQKGTLHPDSLQAAGKYPQCSYNVCHKTLKENAKAVDEYLEQYKKKGTTPFTCYYNTQKPDELIATKKHTKSDVIHSMLWPSVVILICGIIFVRLEMKRRGLDFCASGLPDQMPYGDQKKTVLVAKYNMAGDHKVECKPGPPACSLLRHQENAKLLSSSLSSLDRLAKHNDSKLQQVKQIQSGSSANVNRLVPGTDPWKTPIGGSADRIKTQQQHSSASSVQGKNDKGKHSPASSPVSPKIKIPGPNERTSSVESQGSQKSLQSQTLRAETPV